MCCLLWLSSKGGYGKGKRRGDFTVEKTDKQCLSWLIKVNIHSGVALFAYNLDMMRWQWHLFSLILLPGMKVLACVAPLTLRRRRLVKENRLIQSWLWGRQRRPFLSQIPIFGELWGVNTFYKRRGVHGRQGRKYTYVDLSRLSWLEPPRS